MTTTDIRPGHLARDAQSETAGPEQDTRTDQSRADIQAGNVGAGSDIPTSHGAVDFQSQNAGGEQTPEPTNVHSTSTVAASTRAQDTATAREGTRSTVPAPLPFGIPDDQDVRAAHVSTVVGGSSSANPATTNSTPKSDAPGLADPLLALSADVLDDLEKVRIANENRLRQLTRTATDADGEDRGFGLDQSHPDVARLANLVQALTDAEHQATLQLQRAMRRHPLGPWIKAQKGVGEKQAARLLASIRDPYWNDKPGNDRPRTVSELWAYCGYKPGQRRRRGEKANWSTAAKMRAYLIAESMLRAGNRDLYDARKAATEGRVHEEACVRCGPSGTPAQPGSPWSDGHRHADALRIVAKRLLRDLWVAARDIHHGQCGGDTQAALAVVDPATKDAAA